MAIMTEEIEISDRKANRMLPKREIPILDYWYIRTYERKDGTQNEYNTRIDVLLESTDKTVVCNSSCRHNSANFLMILNLLYCKTAAKVAKFSIRYPKR
jgi:hypothetical protein